MKLRVVAACALALALAACGGGGGGTGSPTPPPVSSPPAPPPPPPPANAAPELRYSVSSASPDEGQPFWIDTSGTTDADGDTLTIKVTQVSGPVPSDIPIYEDVPAGDGIFTFRAPEVDADSVMEFEISVSDGEETRTEIAAVTATNIVLGPEMDILGTPYRTFDDLTRPSGAGLYSNNVFSSGIPERLVEENLRTGILGVMDAEDRNGLELFRYPSDTRIEEFGDIDKSWLRDSSSGDEARLTTILRIPAFNSGVVPIVTIESANKLYVMLTNVHDDMQLVQMHDVEAPCAVSYIEQDSQYKYNMVVGKRGGGLQVFRQLPEGPELGIGNYEPGVMLAETGSFCWIHSSGIEVAAYDSERSQIRVWRLNSDQPNVYDEIVAFPIELPETDLELADVEIRCNYTGFNQGFIAAFLFSDGQHDGRHELHVFSNGYRGEEPIQSKVFSWDKGRPVEVEYIPYMDGTDREGFAVVLETAPYMIWIPDNGARYSTDLYPAFEEMFYVPTGLWLTSIREGAAGNFGKHSLTLTYSKLGKVVLNSVINLPWR